MKKLSIIIVNYNSEEFLMQCLESLGNIPSDWEIIIVDNGSRKKLQIPNYKFQIIQNEKNTGFAHANNQGIRHATGKYVLLLNPDTIASQKAINQVIDYMELHLSVGIATCRVELAWGDIDDACHRGFPTPWNAFCYFTGIAKLFPRTQMFNGYHLGYQHMDRIHEIDACAGAFMMIRRKAGEQVKWLDEDYFWYGEDLDFCYRIKKQNWKVMYIPDPSIVHYKGVSSGIKNHSKDISTADKETIKKAQKARFEVMHLFYEKHYAPTDFWFKKMLVGWGIALLQYYAHWR